jgi:hypothetical protein
MAEAQHKDQELKVYFKQKHAKTSKKDFLFHIIEYTIVLYKDEN